MAFTIYNHIARRYTRIWYWGVWVCWWSVWFFERVNYLRFSFNL